MGRSDPLKGCRYVGEILEKEVEKVGLEKNKNMDKIGVVRKKWGAFPGGEKSRTECCLHPRRG